MWTVIITAISTMFTGWIQVKKSKQEAEVAYHTSLAKGEQDWDLEAQRAARYSWKDEFITIIWFAPMLVAWFDPERSTKWINFISGMPYWYQFGMFGIICASFGLRWYFKKQNFIIKDTNG